MKQRFLQKYRVGKILLENEYSLLYRVELTLSCFLTENSNLNEDEMVVRIMAMINLQLIT